MEVYCYFSFISKVSILRVLKSQKENKKNKQKTPLDNSQSFYADSFKASHKVLCDVSKRVIAWSV